MRLAASIPSSPGIFTSRTARSGRSLAASATASSPSLASAQTSNPALSSRLRRSRRMIVSSSATRMRNGVTRAAGSRPAARRRRRRARSFRVCRQPGPARRSGDEEDLRAKAAVARERQRSAQLVADERPDDREARAVGGLARPDAVVGDGQRDTAVLASELHPYLVAAVLECVLEQLAEHERERGGAFSREGDLPDPGL